MSDNIDLVPDNFEISKIKIFKKETLLLYNLQYQYYANNLSINSSEDLKHDATITFWENTKNIFDFDFIFKDYYMLNIIVLGLWNVTISIKTL